MLSNYLVFGGKRRLSLLLLYICNFNNAYISSRSTNKSFSKLLGQFVLVFLESLPLFLIFAVEIVLQCIFLKNKIFSSFFSILLDCDKNEHYRAQLIPFAVAFGNFKYHCGYMNTKKYLLSDIDSYNKNLISFSYQKRSINPIINKRRTRKWIW